MHPIERLRYVARASGADQALLVRETARRARRARHGTGRSGHRLPPHRRPPPDVGAPVVAVRPAAHRARAAGRGPPGRPRRSADDRTGRDAGLAELPEDSLVCVVGWPDVVGRGAGAPGRRAGAGGRLRWARGRAWPAACAGPRWRPPRSRPSGLGAAAAAADLVRARGHGRRPRRVRGVAGAVPRPPWRTATGIPVWLAAGVGPAAARADVGRPRAPDGATASSRGTATTSSCRWRSSPRSSAPTGSTTWTGPCAAPTAP